MKIFANRDTRHFFFAMFLCMTGIFFLIWITVYLLYQETAPVFYLLFPLSTGIMGAVCFWYFRKQDRMMESAVSRIDALLAGDTDARIDCEEEGELYRLFHCVNTLAAVLNAHLAKEQEAKEFLKNTISDISHQLKTPLAALSIYNGLLQNEAEQLPTIREFATLSEQELDRMETLVRNLLKMARLDAGAIVTKKETENVADMMKDVELHFSYRAKKERKELVLSGAEDVRLFCDRDWMLEAIDNLVKNAFDHTKEGDTIRIEWKGFPSAVRIVVKDNGSGIAPEDMPHIFKRFYRSKYSQDVQGVGLGLPLAKAIVEAHGGSVEADSEAGRGTVFILTFLIPAKL